MAKKEVIKHEEEHKAFIPFGEVDRPKSEGAKGLEGLGQTDYKMGRMKRLDPKSPEVSTFAGEAIPGHFWHTGVQRDMGTEFLFVPCTVVKRVVLWAPREMGGGVLAMSRDGVYWSQGANQTFTVNINGIGKPPAIWRTGSEVRFSSCEGVPNKSLLEWGTYDPQNERSGPAAQLSYEYLCWLVDYPELSPVFMGCYRTALANAKQLNTALLALKAPITDVVVRCFVESKKKDSNEWTVSNFQLKGWAPDSVKEKTRKVAEAAKGYLTPEVPVDREEAEVDNPNY